MLRVLDLFSGIGGFSLGLERTGGFKTVAFCEIEPFCRRVLAKHWPEVPCYHDVRTLTADTLARDGIAVDVICGGFPCQDISVAGKGAGLAGERSGLWSEYARLIDELRPRFVIVENVAALLGRGLDRVLGDLAALGFDAEWHCIPASAVGAPHRRDRLWIVAYAHSNRTVVQGRYGDNYNLQWHRSEEVQEWEDELVGLIGASNEDVAHPIGLRELQPQGCQQDERRWIGDGCEAVSEANLPRLPFSWALSHGSDGKQGGGVPSAGCWWATEPDVGRVAHGVPARVDRLKSLGNAVVPQIPELIGRAILEAAV